MSPVCPYCNSDIPESDNVTHCRLCGAAHHSECWEENDGCTVFGCEAAPREGPTIRVDASELAAPPPPLLAGSAPVPPPPMPGPPVLSTFGGYPAVYPVPNVMYAAPAGDGKSRVVYVLLGVFLGFTGAHNFYAGYTGRAFTQISLTFYSFFAGGLISWIWAIVEVCTIERDGHNVSFT